MKSSAAAIAHRRLYLRLSCAAETASYTVTTTTQSYSPLHSRCTKSNIRSHIVMRFSTTNDTTTAAAATEALDETNDNRSRILSLYRSIRRIHERSLPTNLRDMGNKYLQSEFRTLKDTTKMTPQHFQNFMTEWEKYRQQLLQSQSERKFGKPLPSDTALTAEQQEQLRKLHQEVTLTNTDTDNKLG